MRVALHVEQFDYKAGLFKREPRWKVICAIEFSEEEKQIIKDRRIGDEIIYTQELGNGDEGDPMELKRVVRDGIWSIFRTPAEADAYAEQLQEVILPALKSYIYEETESQTQPRTFEL